MCSGRSARSAGATLIQSSRIQTETRDGDIHDLAVFSVRIRTEYRMRPFSPKTHRHDSSGRQVFSRGIIQESERFLMAIGKVERAAHLT